MRAVFRHLPSLYKSSYGSVDNLAVGVTRAACNTQTLSLLRSCCYCPVANLAEAVTVRALLRHLLSPPRSGYSFMDNLAREVTRTAVHKHLSLFPPQVQLQPSGQHNKPDQGPQGQRQGQQHWVRHPPCWRWPHAAAPGGTVMPAGRWNLRPVPWLLSPVSLPSDAPRHGFRWVKRALEGFCLDGEVFRSTVTQLEDFFFRRM